MINLSANDSILLEEVLPEMQMMGFDLNDMGGGSYVVNGIPSGIEGLGIEFDYGHVVISEREQFARW